MAQERIGRSKVRGVSRRNLILGGTGAVGVSSVVYGVTRALRTRLGNWTQSAEFAAAPALPVSRPERDKTRIYVARDDNPADNVDSVFSKLGGIQAKVGGDDVVVIKVSAQWWNQGMTNVAAVKRVIEHVIERPGGFHGEVIVFENTHFRMPDGSGLSRAWVRPSERNVDVPGWTSLGDLIPHFRARNAPVSFVGLVDAGPSALAQDHWHDPSHQFGIYGGDGRGPIEPGADRDGYHWAFDDVFELERSPFDVARCLTSWPRFTSPHSGLVVDLRDGVFVRKNYVLEKSARKLVWINLTTANEHSATGLTGATKSTMGVVDMSAGELGTHPLCKGYRSVHYFGRGTPTASWRMAGPLAHFANVVRAPDLILSIAHWVAFTPSVNIDGDIRMEAASAAPVRTVVAGEDPVAIDAWLCRNVMQGLPVNHAHLWNVDSDDSQVAKFLRYYVQVRGAGELSQGALDVV